MDYNQNNYENNGYNQPVEPTYQPPQNNAPQGNQSYNQPPYGAPQYNQAPYDGNQYGQPTYDASQYSQQPYGAPQYNQPMYPPVAPDNSKGLAVTSLVLSILSFICCGFPFSIAGFVCGLVSLSRKKENNGLAVAGVIISVLGFIATIVSIVVIIASGTYANVLSEIAYSYY
ncbi:MAG: DUF4190 domain-containing protein [Ruminococcus sp.]|nr:DUF4190 domain-containing protein [Ruminococcus sp.]